MTSYKACRVWECA